MARKLFRTCPFCDGANMTIREDGMFYCFDCQSGGKLSDKAMDEIIPVRLQKWTPCSEGLPPVYYDMDGNWTSEFVLVFTDCGNYDIGQYNPVGVFQKNEDDGLVWVGKPGKGGIIAWMPLPEPYKETK